MNDLEYETNKEVILFEESKKDSEMAHFIGYHLDKIFDICKDEGIQSVVEIGTRGLCSTCAFLKAKVKNITTYDICDITSMFPIKYNEFLECSKELNLNFIFIQEDSLKAEIQQCDILFLDTVHTYNQVSQELKRHSNKVKKHIIIHDTCCSEIDPEIQSGEGVTKAISDFLEKNNCWKITYETKESQGLTILSRLI